ncbi:hypothetical protein P7C70_g8926, partial [Phenoliferia sp. Uapishka_3]
TPFLISVFSHPFATAATPAGEAIRVRVAGALGWIGRRSNITPAENETIGLFLLSLLPHGKTTSPLSPTPKVLLQAIDSIIGLYLDEDAPYDVPVLRQKVFLGRLEDAVAGVRAATRGLTRGRPRNKVSPTLCSTGWSSHGNELSIRSLNFLVLLAESLVFIFIENT